MSRTRRRRPEVIAAICIVLAVAVAAIWLAVGGAANSAQPFADLHISWFEPRFIFTSESTQRFDEYRKLQAKLVRSPIVLHAVLLKPEISTLAVIRRQDAPAAWLEEAIQVELYGTEFLRVSMNGADGQDAAMIINAAVDVYISEFAMQGRKDLESKLQVLRDVEHKAVDALKARKLRNSLERTDAQNADVLEGELASQQVLLQVLRDEITQLEIESEKWMPRISVFRRAEFPARQVAGG